MGAYTSQVQSWVNVGRRIAGLGWRNSKRNIGIVTLNDFRIPSALPKPAPTARNPFADSPEIGLRDWGPFTIPVDPYFPELLWEFYASYRSRQHYLQHKGSSTTWPCLTSVCVHGLEIPVTPEAINSLYWVEPIPSHPIFRMKMDNKAQKFQWVAHIIAHGQPQGALSRGLIHRHNLKYEARMWLDFVFSRLIPS
ncbi:hypothetical protein HAX54_040513 [Datura stramonium]|uniref:Putative plant transposon protein domain-containing protein n=1 Tax=Datura stramonium TaxID=4076 RepID=A0ABS8VMS0_DATST|nr:hypothetical protein [Datura stramonium]